jgi:hypothetical protein
MDQSAVKSFSLAWLDTVAADVASSVHRSSSIKSLITTSWIYRLRCAMAGPVRFSSRRKGRKVKPYPIGVRDGGAVERPKPAEYSDIHRSQFADVAGAKYPIDKEHVRPALAYWSKPENRGFYTKEKQEEITRRIVEAALRYDLEVTYNPEFMKYLPLTTKEKLKGFFPASRRKAQAR